MSNTLVLSRQQLIDEMNDALRTEYEWLVRWRDKGSKMALLTIWELGCRIKKIHDETHKYGERAVEKVATAFGESPDYLYKSMHLARDFPEKEQIEELSALRMKHSGRPLTTNHIWKFLAVDSRTARDHLIAATIEKDWTPGDVQDAIDAAKGHTKTPTKHTGRKMAIPPSLLGKLNNACKISKTFADSCEKIWTPVKHGVLDGFQEADPARLTPDVLGKLDSAIGELERVASCVQRALDQFRQAREVTEESQGEQASAAGSEQAEELEEPSRSYNHRGRGRRPVAV